MYTNSHIFYGSDWYLAKTLNTGEPSRGPTKYLKRVCQILIHYNLLEVYVKMVFVGVVLL